MKHLAMLSGGLLLFTASALLADRSYAISADRFQVRDTEDLAELCLVAEDHPLFLEAISFCHGFGEGAWRYHMATLASHEADFVCMPAEPVPIRATVLRDFALWAKNNPEYLEDEAVGTLFRYLELRFPCK